MGNFPRWRHHSLSLTLPHCQICLISSLNSPDASTPLCIHPHKNKSHSIYAELKVRHELPTVLRDKVLHAISRALDENLPITSDNDLKFAPATICIMQVGGLFQSGHPLFPLTQGPGMASRYVPLRRINSYCILYICYQCRLLILLIMKS